MNDSQRQALRAALFARSVNTGKHPISFFRYLAVQPGEPGTVHDAVVHAALDPVGVAFAQRIGVDERELVRRLVHRALSRKPYALASVEIRLHPDQWPIPWSETCMNPLVDQVLIVRHHAEGHCTGVLMRVAVDTADLLNAVARNSARTVNADGLIAKLRSMRPWTAFHGLLKHCNVETACLHGALDLMEKNAPGMRSLLVHVNSRWLHAAWEPGAQPEPLKVLSAASIQSHREVEIA